MTCLVRRIVFVEIECQKIHVITSGEAGMRYLYKHSILLLILSILLILEGGVSVSQGKPLRDTFKGYPLRDSAEGTTVSVTMKRQHFYPGEDVPAEVHIRCEKPCIDPYFGGFDINWDFHLMRNDSVKIGPHVLGGPLTDGEIPTGPKRYAWNYGVNMGSWGDQATQDSLGVRFLMPGSYVGRYSNEIESPDFHFTVDPVPDSLLPAFNAYVILQRLWEPKYGNGYTGENADTIRNCLKLFLSGSRSCPWRTQALCRSLNLADRWPQLLTADSLLWQNTVLALIHDLKPDGRHQSDIFRAFEVGQKVFFGGQSQVEGAKSILTLTKKHGNSATVKCAKNWLVIQKRHGAESGARKPPPSQDNR
jgi:hypothetical protein